MPKIVLFVLCVFLSYGEVLLFQNIYKNAGKLLNVRAGADVGEPLILTPFLKNGSILEAQRAALVQIPKFLDLESYAGYFTVDERFDSNMWFWYFPSAGNITNDPVILWLEGGPGATGLLALFDANGPLVVSENGTVSLREYSWHKDHSLIFVDNPVGVGFSFTNGGLAENVTKVADDLYSFLTQFYQLFPDLQTNPFFLSGESYAGKYLPATSYAIMKNNPQAELKINLQGTLIGDGLTDPINQLNYGPYAYNLGLISAALKEDIDRVRDETIAKITRGEYRSAEDNLDAIVNMIVNASEISIYNYVNGWTNYTYWENVVTSDEIRKALNVGDTVFGDKGAGDALLNDTMRSVAPLLEEFLESYRVLIYVGQLDVVLGYPMIVDYLQALNFTGAEAFRNSSRDIWYVDQEAAGYVRTGGNLVELLVRNAGHFVPRDQPKWGQDMVYRFTRNITFG